MSNIFVVSEDYENERIDHYLSVINPELSRNYIQKLIKSGLVLVNNKPVKASYRVLLDDSVSVSIPEAISPDILPEDIPLDILYEDNDVILINKPKDIVVHPAAGHYSGTIVNALLYHCGYSLSGINGVMRPGIVHRIDKDTTGVIIACKNDFTHNAIAEQLKNHNITRRYYALVCGNIKEDGGTVDKPIGRCPNDRKKMSVNFNSGKNAVTHFKVLERFGKYTFIECQLETGRTHQIRVHMASIGHPLLGDGIYGGEVRNSLKGQCLHAYILGFIHPRTNLYMEFTAPLPEYFQNLLNTLRR